MKASGFSCCNLPFNSLAFKIITCQFKVVREEHGSFCLSCSRVALSMSPSHLRILETLQPPSSAPVLFHHLPLDVLSGRVGFTSSMSPSGQCFVCCFSCLFTLWIPS